MPSYPLAARTPGLVTLVAALVLLAGGCADDAGETDSSATTSGGAASSAPTPEVGQCRVLTPADVAEASDDTSPVDCAEEQHTAQTYAAGELPDEQRGLDWDSADLAAWAYDTCSRGFGDFLRADESTVMRTILSWAWFRPSRDDWDAGVRHYRCDVVGGGEQVADYRPLPTDAAGLLEPRPGDQADRDRWMVCAAGPRVSGSTKVSCDEEHSWRAVTTIKVGDAGDDYPGARYVEVTTADFCSDSVGAWLGYPDSYDYGYTYFGEAEWEVGNRRSVCWAKTAQ